ncbi:DUF1203 domain-containing protein [Brevundimonas sp. LjRoot202]|uniref:DUF1203 domain-containing protein n=1 Tax=Brevundimonas sp. LjRoot202 TaxID=3342281 RepID=UPI003ED14B46
MSFRIQALSPAPFLPLFDLDDEALAAIGARRMIADAPHAAPCRVSLADAEPGERLLLINHRHLDAPASPYRGDGPIFVREGVVQAVPAAGEVPDMLGRRLLSARIYDADWMMTDADVVEGRDLAGRLETWFADPAVSRIHLHTARRGCFMATAGRI